MQFHIKFPYTTEMFTISFCRKKKSQSFPTYIIIISNSTLEAKSPLKTQLLPGTKLSYDVKAEASEFLTKSSRSLSRALSQTATAFCLRKYEYTSLILLSFSMCFILFPCPTYIWTIPILMQLTKAIDKGQITAKHCQSFLSREQPSTRQTLTWK